jgi:DNA-binding CsgD family transcriptional regulator
VRRGDVAIAEQNLGELRSLADRPETQQLRTFPLDAIEIEYLLEKGDVSVALGRAAKVLSVARRDEPRYLWPLLSLAARACTEGKRANTDKELNVQVEKLRPLLDEFGCELESHTRLDRAHAAVFAAERLGANDVQGSSASWSAAAALWRELGHPYPLAYALMRAAMACPALDRDASAAQLRQAAEIATELGAKSLLAQINSFAKRSRLDGGGVVREEPLIQKPFDLTRRELEVLRLVSAGHNNRQIADTLFISVKTASVHVSNILSKLGVASRGVAAATAHKLHLFD